MSTKGYTPTPKQEAVATALAAGMSVRKAAASAGAAPRTVTRWKADRDFLVLVQRKRDEMFSRAVGRLTRIAGKAAGKLAGLLDSADERVQLGACKEVLAAALKTRELFDLTAQVAQLRQDLDQLRKAQAGNNGRGHSVYPSGGNGQQ
jgi:transposase-like protein